MRTVDTGREARRRLSSPRIAETVADELRRQIVDGELADGDLLPPQAVLVEKFNVSLVSLREALRILETEGLLSVRRGNQGGAAVHAPAKESAAYMLGLLLQSEHIALGDLAAALQNLEPTCAALAAQRANRVNTVVSELAELNTAMSAALDDGHEFAQVGRAFHGALVRGCGNATVIAVVSSLEALWSKNEQRWATETPSTGDGLSPAERQAVLKTHVALTDAIELGDSERARSIAARHLVDARIYVPSGDADQRILATAHNPLSRTPDRRA